MQPTVLLGLHIGTGKVPQGAAAAAVSGVSAGQGRRCELVFVSAFTFSYVKEPLQWLDAFFLRDYFHGLSFLCQVL